MFDRFVGLALEGIIPFYSYASHFFSNLFVLSGFEERCWTENTGLKSMCEGFTHSSNNCIFQIFSKWISLQISCPLSKEVPWINIPLSLSRICCWLYAEIGSEFSIEVNSNICEDMVVVTVKGSRKIYKNFQNCFLWSVVVKQTFPKSSKFKLVSCSEEACFTGIIFKRISSLRCSVS